MVALIVFVALAAACSSSGSEERGTVVIREEVVEDAPVVPSEPSAQILREERIYIDPAPLGAYQETHGVAPLMLDPGRHTFDELGIELTLNLEEYWRLDTAHPGSLLLTEPSAGLDPLLPALTIHRPIGFAAPFNLVSDRLGAGPTGWQAEWELADWIEANPQVVLLDEGTIPVGDRTARWFDIEVDPDLGPTMTSCQPGACVALMWSGKHTHSVARSLERIRWYEIPDPQGPIVGFVSASDEQWPSFVAAADRLFGGATLGESQPKPIPERTANAIFIELPSNESWGAAGIPGVRFESRNFFVLRQRPGLLTPRLSSISAGVRHVGLATPVTDGAGAPLTTADEVVAAIVDGAEEVIEVADGEMMGFPATVIDFDHASPGLLLLAESRPGYDPSFSGWPHDIRRVRAWVFDSPLGPTVVFAGGAEERGLQAAVEEIPWLVEITTICDGATDSCEPAR